VPGISNGTHTHTGAASGSGIAATTITGSGSGATFAYDFDTLGVLTTLTADGAGSGYKVGDKLSIDTTEGHTIEFRLVEGSNAATVSVSMGAAKPNKPIPFPVTKMRVADSTDRQVLIMDQRSRYVFPKPTPYLLDTYEGAAAAYSLRRLRSAYTGPAVRVRRASNNDELDIYFDGQGNLDTAALEAFCAGTNGFVKVWYDQGPGGNNAEQTAATAAQPKIYDASTGVLVTANGIPRVLFNGTSHHLRGPSISASSATMTVVCEQQSTSLGNRAFGVVDADLIANKETFAFDSDFSLRYDGASSLGSLTPVTGTEIIRFATRTTSAQTDHVNGVSNVADTKTLPTMPASTLEIGNVDIVFVSYFDGYICEAIFYDSDQSSNRTGIETNINEHYGIYEFSGLLDDYSGAAAAYSLRRLSSTYTGPAIRVVKHDVGYPEMDIPFEDDGTLSVVLLEAFADGYDATVKVWYDQSGGSNDAEQSTLASQPKIVDAGTVIYENGLPAVEFDGASSFLESGTLTTATQPISIITTSTSFNNTVSGSIISTNDANDINDFYRYDGGFAINAGTTLTSAPGVTYANNTQYLRFSLFDGGSSEIFVNGTSVVSGDANTAGLNGTLWIGRFGVAGTILTGVIQEVIIYASDQTSNRTGIETNVNDFYSIYP
jgi:hypothetical protein